MKPSKALTIKKHEAQLRVYGVKRKEISIQDYSSGIYLINVSNDINTKVFKLLKN